MARGSQIPSQDAPTYQGVSSGGEIIAEGCGRNTRGELLHFLSIALGSANEIQNDLIVARDLAYIDQLAWETANEEIMRLKRMLATLSRKVSASTAR